MSSSARGFLICIGLLCAGAAIAWVDSRPTWDDTGVTAGAIVITAAVGTLVGVRYWMSAVLTVAPILLMEARTGAGVLLVAPLAVVGSAAGGAIRRLARRQEPTMRPRQPYRRSEDR